MESANVMICQRDHKNQCGPVRRLPVARKKPNKKGIKKKKSKSIEVPLSVLGFVILVQLMVLAYYDFEPIPPEYRAGVILGSMVVISVGLTIKWVKIS